MRGAQDKIERIESYLDKEMSEKDRALFERELQTNDELKSLVNQEKLLRQGLQYADLSNLEGELKSLDDQLNAEFDNGSKARAFDRPAYLRWAAVLIPILIIAGLFFWQGQNKNNGLSDFLSANFEPYENKAISVTRGGVNELNDAQKVFLDYDKNDFKAAERGFRKLLDASPDNGQYQFYFGVTLLGLGKSIEARDVFQKHVDNNQPLSNQAKWYLALAHLDLGESEMGLGLLKELTDSDSSFYKQARLLLQSFQNK